MTKRHTDATPGWVRRRFATIEKQIRELSAARRLDAATIGRGGLTIRDGGTVTGKYVSGRSAFLFGALTNNSFGVQILKDEPDSDTKVNLLDVYRIGPILPYFPTGANIVQSLGGDFFLAKGAEGASLSAGPPGVPDVAGVTVVADGGGIDIKSTSGDIIIDAGTAGVKVMHSTTGASANCFIDPSDSRIWRSTSSRRYKQDVEDVEVDPASVLQMQGRTWRDKAEVEADQETERRYVGFIAEELHDLGLGQFVVYDSDNEPEAIAYDRLSVALLEVVKSLDARLKKLEGAS